MELDTRRSFSISQRKELWHRQKGKCGVCKHSLNVLTAQYHHVKPWAEGGRTILENGQAVCPECHGIETHKQRLDKFDKKR